MVASFVQLNSLPDILASDRHTMYFPDKPGVDGRALTLLNTQVTLPSEGVGQILVKIGGHSLGFAGSIQYENLLTLNFYDTAKGQSLTSLLNWLQLVRNRADGSTIGKPSYSSSAKFEVANTVGDAALIFDLYNVFPIRVQPPEFGQDGAPAEITADFNVDLVKLRGSTLSLSQFRDQL